MRTLAIAAAFALIGTAAGAQMNTTHTTTTTPMGTATATTTTRTPTDGMSGRADERTVVRTHSTTMRHRTVAMARTHCKTWWKHGRKMRSCKTMVHRHM